MTTRTAVITGADQPFGTAVARALSPKVDTILLGGTDEARLNELVEELEAHAGTVTSLRTDVRDEFDVERLMETASRLGGGSIDYIVPCARVSHLDSSSPITAWSYAGFDDELRTNLRGVFASVREAIPHCDDDSHIVVPREDGSSTGTLSPIAEHAIDALVELADADGPTVSVVTVERISSEADVEPIIDALLI